MGAPAAGNAFHMAQDAARTPLRVSRDATRLGRGSCPRRRQAACGLKPPLGPSVTRPGVGSAPSPWQGQWEGKADSGPGAGYGEGHSSRAGLREAARWRVLLSSLVLIFP